MASNPTKPLGSLDATMLARRGLARRAPIVFAQSEPEAVPDFGAEVPEVLRQVERLAQALAGETPAPATVPGRRIAFTLRIDSARHAHLRQIVTAQGRSAQQVLIDALDQYLQRAGMAIPTALPPVLHHAPPTGTRP
jgi:hypothetical protein